MSVYNGRKAERAQNRELWHNTAITATSVSIREGGENLEHSLRLAKREGGSLVTFSNLLQFRVVMPELFKELERINREDRRAAERQASAIGARWPSRPEMGFYLGDEKGSLASEGVYAVKQGVVGPLAFMITRLESGASRSSVPMAQQVAFSSVAEARENGSAANSNSYYFVSLDPDARGYTPAYFNVMATDNMQASRVTIIVKDISLPVQEFINWASRNASGAGLAAARMESYGIHNANDLLILGSMANAAAKVSKTL